MSSKGNKKPFNDSDNGCSRKKKRLKKISSNLFDDDDDDDTYEEKENILISNNQIKDNNKIDNNSSGNKSLNKSGFIDIKSYFKPSTKASEEKNLIRKSNTTDDKVTVKNVNDYFNILQKDNKNVKNEDINTSVKKERSENDIAHQETNKKNVISPSRNKTKCETNEDLPSFDYLPFNNQKFVLTGVFKNFSRDELQSKIKEHGGSVMTAVSTKTHYLIHGEYLEDGRLYNEGRKYLKAFELQQQKKSNIKILNEEELLKLLPEEKNQTNNNLNEANKQEITIKEESDVSISKNPDFYFNKNDNNNNETKNEKQPLNQLWVEKYRPKNINELVGNNQNVIKLQNWLSNWEDVCIKEKKEK